MHEIHYILTVSFFNIYKLNPDLMFNKVELFVIAIKIAARIIFFFPFYVSLKKESPMGLKLLEV